MSKKPETIQVTHCDAPDCDEKIVEGGKRHMVVKENRTMTLFKSSGDAFTFVTLAAGDYHLSCGIAAETKAIRSAQSGDARLPFPEGGTVSDPAASDPAAPPADKSAKSFFRK